jgi:bloom syndrome protein
MTRHNLASHIAWLLSHEASSRVDVNETIQTSSRTVEFLGEECLDWEALADLQVEDSLLSPGDTQATSTINVSRGSKEFIRPPIPTTIPTIVSNTTAPSQLARRLEEIQMVRQMMAPGLPKPGLISQHQLATPVSTTSTAASSSLTHGYKEFLQANGKDVGPLNYKIPC